MQYLNVAAAFDIETTSVKSSDGTASGICWHWQFKIEDWAVFGRSLDTFTDLMDRIHDLIGDQILPVYVHNLSFEFQFIRKLCKWDDVFAMEGREVIRARTTSGIEFRDSLKLTGKGLAATADDLHMRKLVGDLDYSVRRHPGSPVFLAEKKYCYEDVNILVELIRKKIRQDGDVTAIPMTKTGYVRRYIRSRTIYSKDFGMDYRKTIRRLTMDPEEFLVAHRGYQGGYTHSFATNTGRVYDGERSWDITSSYPTSMFAYKNAMGKGVRHNGMSATRYREMVDHGYLMVGDVTFIDLQIREGCPITPLSRSKCTCLGNVIEDNGRVAFADNLTTTTTSVDMWALAKAYTWAEIRFGLTYSYTRDWLPAPLLSAMLNLYVDKTSLKGVSEREDEYILAKENLNSLYGSFATSPVRTNEVYTDDWQIPDPPDVAECVDKYNNDKSRYYSYIWAVFITAYSRRAVMAALLAVGEDVIYCDTDSTKILHNERHEGWYRQYNERMHERLIEICGQLGIDSARVHPATKKGVEKWLGDWDAEDADIAGGVGARFKTLGAKRYIYQYPGEPIHSTIAGVGKEAGRKWLAAQPDPWSIFTRDLIIPPEGTGKLTHIYQDDPVTVTVMDFAGIAMAVTSMSSVYLEPCSYSMSIAPQYLWFLRNVAHVDI